MIPTYWPRIALLTLLLYPGLAIVSEVVMRWLQLPRLRDALWTLISPRRNTDPTESSVLRGAG